jgi:hypothetical protein
MPTQRLVRLLACLFVALAPVAASTAPAAKAPPADLDAFVKTLPPPGRDRVFLALPAELETRLAIDPAVVRAVDPGVACDPASKSLNMAEASLGLVAHVQTTCTPDGLSNSLLTLPDGNAFVTICGPATGLRVTATVDVTVGDKSLHASTQSPTPAREPAHDCTGWTKLPR